MYYTAVILNTIHDNSYRRRTGRGRGGGGGGALAPHFFADGIFFYMRTPGIPNQKSQADADMQPI